MEPAERAIGRVCRPTATASYAAASSATNGWWCRRFAFCSNAKPTPTCRWSSTLPRSGAPTLGSSRTSRAAWAFRRSSRFAARRCLPRPQARARGIRQAAGGGRGRDQRQGPPAVRRAHRGRRLPSERDRRLGAAARALSDGLACSHSVAEAADPIYRFGAQLTEENRSLAKEFLSMLAARDRRSRGADSEQP